MTACGVTINNKTQVSPLYKYLPKNWAETMIGRGSIKMDALSYFRDYEDAGVRQDEYEGTLVHRPEGGLVVKKVASGEEVPLDYSMEFTAHEDDIFVYCLSTECSASIAKRFGTDCCVEIAHPVKFIARLRNSLALRRQLDLKEMVHGPVRYYEHHEPPIVDWALPERITLRKPKSFDWQHEYRFAVPRNNAFGVENVKMNLVKVGTRRALRQTAHPRMLLSLGSMSKFCRLHRFTAAA